MALVSFVEKVARKESLLAAEWDFRWVGRKDLSWDDLMAAS